MEQSLKQSIEQYCSRHGLTRFEPKAALIDMDGTLYDSMPHHAAAWTKMMAEEVCTIVPEDIYINEGMTGVATAKLLLKRELGKDITDEYASELYARKARYFAQMPQVKTIDGASEMIEGLLRHDITTVLVTGSAQGTTLGRLDTDFPGAFPADRRVTANDVKHGKPDSEPFVKAMQIAGCEPSQAIVIDNAPLGVTAGSRSGAYTIGVTTGPVPVAALYEAGADYVFSSMKQLVAHLTELMQ